MGYIKKLKNNELVGGTDKTTIYPVTSTKAVFEEVIDGDKSSFKSQETINKEQQDTLDDHEERIQAAEAEDIKSITINGSTKEFRVDDKNNVDLTIYTVDNDPEMPSIASNVEDLRNMVGTSTPVLETSHKTRIETLEGGESVTGSVENKIKTKIDSINSSYQDDNNEYVKYSITQTSGEVTNFNIDETSLKNAITSLNTSISGDNIIVGPRPTTGLPGKIYRVINNNNTYTDWMYVAGDSTPWKQLAIHDTSDEQSQVAYYTCTAAGSGAQATKQFVSNGSLEYTPSSGGHIKILMGEANAATGTIYLQFGTTTSTKKPLYYNGEPASASNTWEAGETIAVYYDPSANNNAGAYFASNAQGGSNKKVDELGDELGMELTYDLADRTVPYCINGSSIWEANDYHQALFKIKKGDVFVIKPSSSQNTMYALIASYDTSVAPTFINGTTGRITITKNTAAREIKIGTDGWLFVYGWNTGHTTNYWPASIVKKWGAEERLVSHAVNDSLSWKELELTNMFNTTRIGKDGLKETTISRNYGIRVYDVSAYHGKRIKIGGVLFKNECYWSIGGSADFDDASVITRVGYFVGDTYTFAHFREAELTLSDDENYIAVGSYFGVGNTNNFIPYVKVETTVDEDVNQKMGIPYLVTDNIHVNIANKTKVVDTTTGDIVDSPSWDNAYAYHVTEIPVNKDTFDIVFRSIAFSGDYGYAFVDGDGNLVAGVATDAVSNQTISNGEIQSAVSGGATIVRITSAGVNNPIVVRSKPAVVPDLYEKIKETNERMISHDFGDYKPLIGSPQLYVPESVDTSDIDEYYDVYNRDVARTVERLGQVYALFDDLATEYPEFFCNVPTDWKDESGTYDVKRYRMGYLYPRATTTRTGAGTNMYDNPQGTHNRRRLIVEMGIHPSEDLAMLGGYLGIKEILKSNEPWAVFIKSNFVIDIIPCTNPWGFVNNVSRNVNDKNLNRCFYEDVQTENRHIMDLIAELKPYGLIGTISPHNTGSNQGEAYFVSRKSYQYWDYYVMLSQNIAAAEFKLFNDVFGTNSTHNHFHAWDTTGEDGAVGQMHMYVDGQGLLGCTFEVDLLANGTRENRKKRAILTKITLINIIQAFGSYY